MANRLKKLANARYTPGVAYRAATKGYYDTRKYWVPGYTRYNHARYHLPSADTTDNAVVFGTPISGYLYSWEPAEYVPGRWVETQTWVPATVGVAAVAPTITYTAITGWNGGGRSVAYITGDGYTTFKVGENNIAVAVGLTNADDSTLPGDLEHGYYVRGTVVTIVEDGATVATSSEPHAYATEFRITRTGSTVTYKHGEFTYVSAKPAYGSLFLDTAMYASGDYVDDPVLMAVDPSGSGVARLAAVDGYGTEGIKANGRAVLPALQFGGYRNPFASGTAVLTAITAVGSDYAYSYGHARLAVPLLTGDGGYPQILIGGGLGYVAPPAVYGHGLTGEIGSGGATLRRLRVKASDYPYSEGSTTLAAIQLRGDDGFYMPDTIDPSTGAIIAAERRSDHTILLMDAYDADEVASARYTESLTFHDEFLPGVLASSSYFDMLILGDTLLVQQSIDALLVSSLRLGDNLNATLLAASQDGAGRYIGDSPTQYAINAVTGAVSSYSSFGFTSFARVGTHLYGLKADGVFLLRPGTDNGDPIEAFVDFGVPHFTSQTNRKHVEDIFLGISTDGTILAKIAVDGVERTYAVQRRGELARAILPKGLYGRTWNISLRVVDAIEADLEFVEIHTNASRRWST